VAAKWTTTFRCPMPPNSEPGDRYWTNEKFAEAIRCLWADAAVDISDGVLTVVVTSSARLDVAGIEGDIAYMLSGCRPLTLEVDKHRRPVLPRPVETTIRQEDISDDQ